MARACSVSWYLLCAVSESNIGPWRADSPVDSARGRYASTHAMTCRRDETRSIALGFPEEVFSSPSRGRSGPGVELIRAGASS